MTPAEFARTINPRRDAVLCSRNGSAPHPAATERQSRSDIMHPNDRLARQSGFLADGRVHQRLPSPLKPLGQASFRGKYATLLARAYCLKKHIGQRGAFSQYIFWQPGPATVRTPRPSRAFFVAKPIPVKADRHATLTHGLLLGRRGCA
ncbi:hypothetical protein CWR43_29670 [Rhizobium sullae]|uniref:Uncharacterized protein n=1 Tax=Rhizobium sullae TaxID=50338 RepID=A0A2N0D1T4_RHISU|nr:hypothetical protein CWR43_29670 [Rhizobium sullae]